MPDEEKFPMRISSAYACAIAATRASEAVALWQTRLSADDNDAVRRKLTLRGEWDALAIWDREMIRRKAK